jgi:low affinity Fe/Cu permease
MGAAAVASGWLGSTWVFAAAGLVVAVWAAAGPGLHFSQAWAQVIGMGTGIATFLMVFLIQGTQNRDSRAINLRLNELIRAMDKTRNQLIDIERLSNLEPRLNMVTISAWGLPGLGRCKTRPHRPLSASCTHQLNCRIVDEYVRPVITSDESVALGVAKPLNHSFVLCHKFLLSLHLREVPANGVNGTRPPNELSASIIDDANAGTVSYPPTIENCSSNRQTQIRQRNVPPPQPESYMMGEIVRGVYPQLKKLRENGYTLKMLVRVFEENGVVITIHALSTYLKNLALPREQAPVKAGSKSTVESPTADVRRGQFQLKPDATL